MWVMCSKFSRSKGLVGLGLAIAVAAGLSACRESEVGRPLTYEKGTYQGQPDTPLDEETRRALDARMAGQRFSAQ
jgi:hypothetical protein